METREKKSIETSGCLADDRYYKQVADIATAMKRNNAPYKASFEIEVEKTAGAVKTSVKSLDGISDEISKMIDDLEKMATEISTSGREPNKVKTKVEIEKEL